MKIKIGKHFTFDASHQLPCNPIYGKCQSLHGHTYHLTVEVEGEIYQIATTHFTWSGEGKISDLQKEHFSKLKSFLADYPELVFSGDLNTPRGQQIYDALAKIYKDNIPKKIDTTVDKNIHKAKKDIRLVIDALFTSPDYKASKVKVVDGVSDHKAIVAEIQKK